MTLYLFFSKLYNKVIDPKELVTLQEDIMETLCKFEMYFPPSFFCISVHLMIHFVREIKECGPAFLQWMYLMETHKGYLKGLVKNRAKLEGSIITRFAVEEASNFCVVFKEKAKEIRISKSRLEGRLSRQGTINRKEIKPPINKISKAHRCVLQHISEVHPYLERHITVLSNPNQRASSHVRMQEHNLTFAEWFQNEVQLALKQSNSNVSNVKGSTTVCY